MWGGYSKHPWLETEGESEMAPVNSGKGREVMNLPFRTVTLSSVNFSAQTLGLAVRNYSLAIQMPTEASATPGPHLLLLFTLHSCTYEIWQFPMFAHKQPEFLKFRNSLAHSEAATCLHLCWFHSVLLTRPSGCSSQSRALHPKQPRHTLRDLMWFPAALPYEELLWGLLWSPLPSQVDGLSLSFSLPAFVFRLTNATNDLFTACCLPVKEKELIAFLFAGKKHSTWSTPRFSSKSLLHFHTLSVREAFMHSVFREGKNSSSHHFLQISLVFLHSTLTVVLKLLKERVKFC